MDAKSYCLLHTSPHSSVASPAQVTSHRGCALTAHCGAQCAADTRLHQLREHPGTPLQRISRADDERSWQCLRPFGGSVWSRLEQRLAAPSAPVRVPPDAALRPERKAMLPTRCLQERRRTDDYAKLAGARVEV